MRIKIPRRYSRVLEKMVQENKRIVELNRRDEIISLAKYGHRYGLWVIGKNKKTGKTYLASLIEPEQIDLEKYRKAIYLNIKEQWRCEKW